MIGIDWDLLARCKIRHPPAPDSCRLRQALLREGVPDRLPLFEIKIDDEVLSAIHVCGNLEKIKDKLIDDMGIDAKHSFEHAIMPMAQVKAKYGHRISILGDVDMHLLALGTAEAVQTVTRQAILDCSPGGGYAFGSGNTIANFIPVTNYLAMLDEAREA
jgi:uroporphyrinogen-III decarboxylase